LHMQPKWGGVGAFDPVLYFLFLLQRKA
jgi:hypothetical protein